MVDDGFLRANASVFEDFWNRRTGDSFFEFRAPGYGYEIHWVTNHRAVLDAAHISAGRYCPATPLPGAPRIKFRVLVVPTLPDTPVPADLSARLQTIGVGDALYQAATPWIQWVTDVKARTSTILLSPSLAQERWQLSRSILDRATLNILVREGVAQLHATTLVRNDSALLFIAPHGTGKSTTAFHLLNAGFRLMGDGLVFARERAPNGASRPQDFELMGYPVGEAKLTQEAKPLFPEWEGDGLEVTAHNVVKHIVNLRKLAPQKMFGDSILPQRIVLCLAARNGQAFTTAEPLAPDETLRRVLPDTIFWDEPEAMKASLGVLERLIRHATCYRLTLGTDRRQLTEAIAALLRD
jgi:hypothetical protein